MKIAVIGTGYVGLVTGTCLAESGNEVVGIDKDGDKIAMLESGRLPIYEPGLLELVQRNRREDRLRFTTDLAEGIAPAQLVFIAVGTPQNADGARPSDCRATRSCCAIAASTASSATRICALSRRPLGSIRAARNLSSS